MGVGYDDASGKGAAGPAEMQAMRALLIKTNNEIMNVARDRPSVFIEYVEVLMRSGRPLNFVNLATLLYNAGKLRISYDLQLSRVQSQSGDDFKKLYEVVPPFMDYGRIFRPTPSTLHLS